MKTNNSTTTKNRVWCVCIYVLFYICIQTDFVNLTVKEKGLTYNMRRALMCVCDKIYSIKYAFAYDVDHPEVTLPHLLPSSPLVFWGRLAINSYLALCQQESDSVACGSAWLTVHSGGWGYRVICVFPSSLQLKK